MNAEERAGRRGGFTLIETLVAMVLTSVILMALVPPLLFSAQQQRLLAAEARRASALEAEANRFTAMPFEEIDAENGVCTLYADGPLPHTRCITVDQVSNLRRDVKIVVTPENSIFNSDSVVVQRALAKESNPFSVGGS